MRHESADRLERLQISQSARLSSGYSIQDDRSFTAIGGWLILFASIACTGALLVQLIKSPLGYVFAAIAGGLAIAWFIYRFQQEWERRSFLLFVGIGVLTAIDWHYLLECINATNSN